ALAIIAFLVLPVRGFFAERDAQIASQRALLARFTATAAQQTRVQAATHEADAQVEQGEFLVGTNEGVIVADLQTRLKATAEAAGAPPRPAHSPPAERRAEGRAPAAR